MRCAIGSIGGSIGSDPWGGRVRTRRHGRVRIFCPVHAHARLGRPRAAGPTPGTTLRLATLEGAAADLVAKLGARAEPARELAYRLYTLCERKKRAGEALSYNGLVQSWPEINRLAREGGKREATQPDMFERP